MPSPPGGPLDSAPWVLERGPALAPPPPRAQAVRERVTARSLGSVTVKGKLQPVEIYDLVDVNPSEGHA